MQHINVIIFKAKELNVFLLLNVIQFYTRPLIF